MMLMCRRAQVSPTLFKIKTYKASDHFLWMECRSPSSVSLLIVGNLVGVRVNTDSFVSNGSADDLHLCTFAQFQPLPSQSCRVDLVVE